MPNYSFLSGNMAKPHEGPWFRIKSKDERAADKIARDSYRDLEKARNAASEGRKLSDIKKDFEAAKNSDTKEQYGKEYLLKKYKNSGWESFIENCYTSTSSYGIDDSNPFIEFIKNRGKGKAYPEIVQQAFADYIFDNPDEVRNKNSWLYGNFSNSKKFTEDEQKQYIKVVKLLHDPYKLKQYTDKSDEELQILIAEVENQPKFKWVLAKLKDIQTKEPDVSYLSRRSQETSKPTQRKGKIRFQDLSLDDIDFTGVENEDKVKELLSKVFKKKDAFTNIR